MNKVSIKLIDKNIYHTRNTVNSTSATYHTKYIEWYWGKDYRDITVFSERSVYEVDNIEAKVKIAWLVEPKLKRWVHYNWVIENIDKFDYVFTYNKELLDIDSEKYHYVPFGTCWIEAENIKIHPKTKNVCMFISGKEKSKWHTFRHQINKQFKDQIDYFGRNNPVKRKSDVLTNYRYAVIVEFSIEDYYFSEKVIDCFATGTVPIYCGTHGIGKFFDLNGIIEFRTMEELSTILNQISIEDYESRLPAIKSNFKQVPNYLTAEDYMYDVLSSLPKVKELL